MKKLCYLFILACLWGCSNNATNSPIVTDDYIIHFAVVDGLDVYEKGMDVGEEFFIYQNGEVLRFEIIVGEDIKFTARSMLTTSQIDSLHIMFEKSTFQIYSETFPEPPFKDPSGSTSISYRKTNSRDLKKITAILSQEPDKYPDGFFELFNYLMSTCY